MFDLLKVECDGHCAVRWKISCLCKRWLWVCWHCWLHSWIQWWMLHYRLQNIESWLRCRWTIVYTFCSIGSLPTCIQSNKPDRSNQQNHRYSRFNVYTKSGNEIDEYLQYFSAQYDGYVKKEAERFSNNSNKDGMAVNLNRDLNEYRTIKLPLTAIIDKQSSLSTDFYELIRSELVPFFNVMKWMVPKFINFYIIYFFTIIVGQSLTNNCCHCLTRISSTNAFKSVLGYLEKREQQRMFILYLIWHLVLL